MPSSLTYRHLLRLFLCFLLGLSGAEVLVAQHNYELYNLGDVLYVSPGEVMTVRGDMHMQGGSLDNSGLIEVQGNLYSDNTFQQRGTGIVRLENNDVNVTDTQFVAGNWAVRGGQAMIGADDGSFYSLELANTQGIVYLVGSGNVADVRNLVDFNPIGASGNPPVNRIITHDISTGIPGNGSGYSATFGIMNPATGLGSLPGNTVSSFGNVSGVDNGYVQGRLRRAISPAGGQYSYVLGLEPAGANAQRGMQYVRLDFSGNDYDVVEGYFQSGSSNFIPGTPIECGYNINYFGGTDHGEWVFEDIAIGSGNYEVWVWPQDDNFPGQSIWFITKDDSVRGNLGQCGPTPVGLSRSAFNGFSEFGVAASSIIFPVTLLSLEAIPRDNRYIEVGWNTIDEENTDHFEVERAMGNGQPDAGDFIYLGEKQAAGNSTVIRNYQFDDHSAMPGIDYHYRLKMVDQDGAFTYSNAVQARLLPGISGMGMEVYPNPASGDWGQVKIEWPKTENAALSVFDARGKLLRSMPLSLIQGENRFSFPLSDLPAGPYLIRVNGGGRQVSATLVRIPR